MVQSDFRTLEYTKDYTEIRSDIQVYLVIKAQGRGPRPNIQINLYESVFQYEVGAFYGMLISRSVLEIFALEFGQVWRKSPFSVNFPI